MATVDAVPAPGAARAVSAWRDRTWTALTRLGGEPTMLVSVAVIILWAIAIAGAGVLAQQDPFAQDMTARLQPPSAVHPFGTDQLGRDVLSRVLHGGRSSLPAAAGVVAFGFLIGSALGAVAGYRGGVVDEVVMRFTDMVLAFPIIILAMAVAAALGASLLHGVIALVAVWWPQYARVCRGLVLELKTRDYVMASRAAGRRPAGILLKVVLPNALPALLVMAAIDVGRAVLNFAMLGFLGLGARPPAPEWGAMVAAGSTVMDQWWVATFPALAILSLVFAFNLVGDSIRDSMDPWLRGRK